MPSGGKDKGVGRWGRQRGMGRLRRTHIKEPGRSGGWERHDEDAEIFDRHGSAERNSHAGEGLVARFNRLAAKGLAEAVPGDPAEVCELRPGLVGVRLPDGSEAPAAIRRSLEKRMVGVRNTLAVGDRVRVAREAGDLAIVAVEPRRNLIARTDAHNRSLQHVLAANIDLVLVVAAVADPDFKHGFVDRMLLVAAVHGVPAALAVTKRDLGDPAPMLGLYAGFGIPCAAADARDPGDAGVARLRGLLAGSRSVIAGQSGVGKSSLVNACFPELSARVAPVAAEGFGRHTTTTARSYPLPGGGALIDTPGIRECSLHGLPPADVALLYPDIARHHCTCRFPDCSHRHEPGCAVLAAVAAGGIAMSRYASYLSIIEGG